MSQGPRWEVTRDFRAQCPDEKRPCPHHPQRRGFYGFNPNFIQSGKPSIPNCFPLETPPRFGRVLDMDAKKNWWDNQDLSEKIFSLTLYMVVS